METGARMMKNVPVCSLTEKFCLTRSHLILILTLKLTLVITLTFIWLKCSTVCASWITVVKLSYVHGSSNLQIKIFATNLLNL